MRDLGLRNLARNTAATLGRQLGGGILQLITLAVIARVYGPEGNGAYTVALLLPTMLATFLNLGIPPANVYYLGAGRVSASTAWNAILRLYAGIVLIGSVLGAAGVLLYGDLWFPGVPSLLLWFALLIFPFSFLLSLLLSFFQGLQEFKQFNLIHLLQPFLTLLGIMALVLLGVENIALLLGAYLAASALTAALAIRALKPFLALQDSPHFPRYGASLLGYGYKAHLSNILAFVNYKADIFLVNFFLGPAGAGIYIIAVQMSERLWLLSQAVSTVLLPRLSQLSNEEGKRKVLTPLITRWVLWVTLFGSLLLGGIAYPFITLIFGDQYIGAVAPLLLLLPGIIMAAASRILANDIAARGRPELNMYTSWLVVIINISANLLLIPNYGIAGAALATSIAYTANFSMRLAMHFYLTGVPAWKNILIGRDDIVLAKGMFRHRA